MKHHMFTVSYGVFCNLMVYSWHVRAAGARLPRNDHENAMSVKPALPRTFVRSQLDISHRAFKRWCGAARLELKGFYEDWEVGLLVEVGKYLSEDRNIDRATQHIDKLLGA
jgi:hypothetical protein